MLSVGNCYKYSDNHDYFFFQAEDGIRDTSVTGVQTCALPISRDAVELFERGKAALYEPLGAAESAGRVCSEGLHVRSRSLLGLISRLRLPCSARSSATAPPRTPSEASS